MPGIRTSKAIHQSRVTLGFMMWCVGIPSGSISEMTAVLRRRFPCYLRFPDPSLADEDGPVPIPTVCLEVISLVASSCGYYRGEIEHRVAQEFTAYVATQRELVERPQHRYPPCAQPLAPMRECHGGRPAAPEAWHRSGTTPQAGTPP